LLVVLYAVCMTKNTCTDTVIIDEVDEDKGFSIKQFDRSNDCGFIRCTTVKFRSERGRWVVEHDSVVQHGFDGVAT